MLGPSKAERLKKLGLAWEPKEFDFYRIDIDQEWAETICLEKEHIEALSYAATTEYKKRSLAWLPSLSQLLAEIEKREYSVTVSPKGTKKVNAVCQIEWIEGTSAKAKWTTADTPDDAAADALIWILEREAKSCHDAQE